MRYTRSMTMVMAMSLICAAAAPAALAESAFVNGLALDGAMLDRSGGIDANTGRVGYFSDIYYDPKRNHWWGLSDRGPGGGTLHYETRVQRFKLDIDKRTGAISDFKILKTVVFRDESGDPLDGIAPNPTSELGHSFDPEGFVVHPTSGHFLVSDEYGPSLYEFNRDGIRVRAFTIPANLIPRNAASGTPNYADDSGNTAGKRTNRGFEGLAIGPRLKGHHYLLLAGTDNDYSVTQNAGGKQFDVYFRFTDADPFVTSIQCPMGEVTGCLYTTGGEAATLMRGYKLLPGVLHAYKVPAADLGDYVRPIHHDDED